MQGGRAPICLLQSVYLSRSASVLRPSSTLRSWYSTAVEKDKKRPPSAPQPKQSSQPTTSKTPSTSTNAFRFNSFENIHSLYFKSKLQQDRVLALDDLLGYVTRNQYNKDTFKDKVDSLGSVKKNAEKVKGKFALFGVFDGHMGKIAAEFVKTRLPFEIVAKEEFASGDYAAALKKSFTAIHKALLQSEAYAPETPNYDFTSGTTASVALVTPTETYFASLGDSPIVIMRKGEDYYLPETLFKGYTADDLKRLKESNVFLLTQFRPTKEGKDRETVISRQIQKFHHGFSNLPLLGSIGDSIYEPENHNAILNSIASYTPERNPDFAKFSQHIQSHKDWAAIQKHFALGKSREDQSWLVNGMYEKTIGIPPALKSSPLSREPQVQQIANSDLLWFSVLSDGVLLKKYEEDIGAMKSVKVLMDYYFEKDPQHMCHVFEKWNYGEFNDDVSGVLVDFQPKQTTEKPKA